MFHSSVLCLLSTPIALYFFSYVLCVCFIVFFILLLSLCFFFFFFFNDTATTEIYTLSLHDALPIFLVPDHAYAYVSYSCICYEDNSTFQDLQLGLIFHDIYLCLFL